MRGGPRPGAGRPKTDDPLVMWFVRVRKSKLPAIKQLDTKQVREMLDKMTAK